MAAPRKAPVNKPEPAKQTDTVIDPSFDFEKYVVQEGEVAEIVEVDEVDPDDLVEISDVVAPSEPTPEYVNVDEPEEELVPLSASELRILELEKQLADLAVKASTPAQPVEPTAEQKRIRDLEDMVARQAAASLVTTTPEYAEPVDGDDVVHFHVLNDGFTAFGKVWYQGQEIKIARSSPEYKSTVDASGESWIDLYDNPRAQFQRWGELKIGVGEWYGAQFNDRIAAEDQARGYSVPVARF